MENEKINKELFLRVAGFAKYLAENPISYDFRAHIAPKDEMAIRHFFSPTLLNRLLVELPKQRSFRLDFKGFQIICSESECGLHYVIAKDDKTSSFSVVKNKDTVDAKLISTTLKEILRSLFQLSSFSDIKDKHALSMLADAILTNALCDEIFELVNEAQQN